MLTVYCLAGIGMWNANYTVQSAFFCFVGGILLLYFSFGGRIPMRVVDCIWFGFMLSAPRKGATFNGWKPRPERPDQPPVANL